ncbi:MAG: hypothetical protein PUD16_13275 [bacterium]|nr:hypothetical protein [bacterium]
MKKFAVKMVLMLLVLMMAFGSCLAEAAVEYPVGNGAKVTIVRKADPDLPTVGMTSYNEAPGVAAWAEQTGIEIEVIEPADLNALLVYLASSDLPDIVVMKNVGEYPGGIGKMVEDGVASDLTDDLPLYAPDYWEYINNHPEYLSNARMDDGRFYLIPSTIYPTGSPYRYWFGMVARQEYLDQLGMEFPKTPDDLYTYLKRCKDELGVETPFMSDVSRWNLAWESGDGSFTAPFGVVSTGVYNDNGTVHYGAAEKEFKDVLLFFNKLYADGLLDPNFTVTDEAIANSAMMSGKSALMLTAASRIANMMKASTDPNFSLVGIPPLNKADGTEAYFVFASTYIEGSFCAFIPETTTGERRINALKLLNYYYTDAGHILSNYGVEGETFDIVDGKYVLNDFMVNNPDALPLDGLLRTYALMNWPMYYDDEMLAQRYGLPEQAAAFKNWAANEGDKYQIQNTSILPKYADEYAKLWTDIKTYMAEYRSQFIIGAKAPETFESEYLPTLEKMGMPRVLEILQESFEAFN